MKKNGFSLVELIIVIAVIGIIAFIAVPSLSGIKVRSSIKADKVSGAEIGKAFVMMEASELKELSIASQIKYSEIENSSIYVAGNYEPESMKDGYYVVTKAVVGGERVLMIGITKNDENGNQIAIPATAIYDNADNPGWVWIEKGQLTSISGGGANIPSETPGGTPGETPGETPEEIPGETPEEIPGETPEEIPEVVVGRYVVTDYGATGNGISNDTSAINATIDAAPDGTTVYFPAGTYLVSETSDFAAVRVVGRKNLTLEFERGATLEHAPTQKARYYTIFVWKSDGVNILGGNLEGEVDTHTKEYGSDGTVVNTHGYGIRLSDSTNILVKDANISDYYGDGICIASDSNPKNGCQNVIIENCTIFDSLRNGITVTSCQGLEIKGCEIYNIMGAYPMAGIDIECEYTGKSNSDIVVNNCDIYDCLYSIEVVSNADNVTIKNCDLENTLHTASTVTEIKVQNSDIGGINANSSSLEVSGCNLGAVGLNNSAANCTFTDCNFSPDSDSQNALCIATGANGATGKFINCKFNAPTTQNKTFYTIWCNAIGNLSFKNCRIDTSNRAGGKGIHGNIGNATFDGCTFINENQNVSGNFLQIDANNVSIINSLFDASVITAYGDNKLIRIYSQNINVQNCELRTANNNTYKPATYAVACNDSVAGDVKFTNNTVPAVWNETNFMLRPNNAASLVIENNRFE